MTEGTPSELQNTAAWVAVGPSGCASPFRTIGFVLYRQLNRLAHEHYTDEQKLLELEPQVQSRRDAMHNARTQAKEIIDYARANNLDMDIPVASAVRSVFKDLL
jgi:hypothetical protein